MKRIEVIRSVVGHVRLRDLIVSCYSPTCHELFYAGDRETNFYVRDSMGMPTSIGLGLALSLPNRKVVVLEGDGGILMNLGSLTTIATEKPKNLTIVILDNGSYENTGGQPTATASATDLAVVARGAGISRSAVVRTFKEFESEFRTALKAKGPTVIVAKIDRGRADVPLITLQHIENKYRFIHAIEKGPSQ